MYIIDLYSTLSITMRLLLVSPLYPPDIAPLAVYVKECAKRLPDSFEVTVLAYSHIPETVTGVRIISVEKNTPLPIRLLAFTRALWSAIRTADIVYVQNGASVELPILLVSLCTHKPIIVHVYDPVALAYTQKRISQRILLSSVLWRATSILHDVTVTVPVSYPHKTTTIAAPVPRPEILPFAEHPTDAIAQYNQSWDNHLATLTTIFTHAT